MSLEFWVGFVCGGFAFACMFALWAWLRLMRRVWTILLAWTGLSKSAICEASKGQADFHDYPGGISANEIDRLRAEIERLRAALENAIAHARTWKAIAERASRLKRQGR